MDLGLVVSHDALHFSEPIPDFRIVQARETVGWWLPSGKTLPMERAPALMQGQGFANIGDETLFWYSVWVLPTAGIRVARWARDRLGYLQPFAGPKDSPHVISAAVATGGKPVAVSLNVSGLGDLGTVRVSVLDEQLHPLSGFGPGESDQGLRSGLRTRVRWAGRDTVTNPGPIRVRVDFAGARPEDVRLYAIYVAPTS